MVVDRLNADGTPDDTFGPFLIGFTTAPLPESYVLYGFENPISVLLKPSNKIVVSAGLVDQNGTVSAITEFESNGTQVMAFGEPQTPGWNVVDFPAETGTPRLALASGTATGSSVLGVAKLDDNGKLEPCFGVQLHSSDTQGCCFLDTDVADVAVQPDRKIVLAGWVATLNGNVKNWHAVVTRLNANGMKDAGFADAGVLELISPFFLPLNGSIHNSLVANDLSFQSGQLVFGGTVLVDFGDFDFQLAKILLQ